MDVIGHQDPGPDLDAGLPRMPGEEVSIEGVVLVAEKSPRPAIAALGDVMRPSGDDDASEAGHAADYDAAESRSQ